jgi:hypothetical protein
VTSEHLFDPAPYTYDDSSRCRDCGAATLAIDGSFEFYMVRDSIWQDAGMHPRGILCIGCLERRLDRQLVPKDFPDVPINRPDPRDSSRLRARREP